MKKIFTLLSVFAMVCGGVSAQEEEAPVYQYKASGTPSSASSVSLKDAEENEVLNITFGQDYSRADKDVNATPKTYTFTDIAKWTSGGFAKNLAGYTFTNFVSGSGNPTFINDDRETFSNPSLTLAPNAGVYVKLTPVNNADIICYVTNVANNKSIYVIGGSTGAKNPTLSYATGSAAPTEWKEYTNGATTNDVFSATANTDIAIKFTAKAGVDYYFFVAGSKMRWVGCTYQQTSAGNAEAAKKIAWISSTDDPDNNDIYKMVSPTDGYEYTAISSNATDVSADSLRTFDAVVISTDVTTDDAMYSVLEQNIAYVPMVNLNANLFGYEKSVVEGNVATATKSLSGLYTIVNQIAFEENNTFSYAQLGVTLPERFKNDVVIGKNGDAVLFHQHIDNRNSYVFLASPEDFGELADDAVWTSLIDNAMTMVAMTKREVSAAASPAASLKYTNGQTTVTLSSGTSGSAVYYSLDGENYERYTDALSFTEPATLYSYAEAEGYTTSSVATHAVDIQTQISSPVISQSHSSNSTTISISSEEGSTIYYSFVNTDATSGMAVYTEPVTVSEPTTVYAVATSAGKLTSEISSQEITIDSVTYETIRLDTLSHMNANVQEYYTNVSEYCTTNYGASGTSSAFYIFGKSSWDYYKTDETGERIKKDSTLVSGESGDVYEYTYEPNPESLRIIDFQNGWVLKSYGQPACYEGIDANARVGNGEAGRSADNVLDLISGAPSKGLFDFNGKKSGDPNSLSIETTVKYAGPFDIVTFLGNGSNSSMEMKAQVSTDGETWQTVGQLEYSANQRYWKRTRLHYEGTDEVYVRIVGGGSKPQLYDVILLNNGELSKQYGKNLAGDVNGDGVVTMADANAIVNYFLADDATRASMKNFNVKAANVNGDEGITMADANAVVNMFLSNQ